MALHLLALLGRPGIWSLVPIPLPGNGGGLFEEELAAGETPRESPGVTDIDFACFVAGGHGNGVQEIRGIFDAALSCNHDIRQEPA